MSERRVTVEVEIVAENKAAAEAAAAADALKASADAAGKAVAKTTEKVEKLVDALADVGDAAKDAGGASGGKAGTGAGGSSSKPSPAAADAAANSRVDQMWSRLQKGMVNFADGLAGSWQMILARRLMDAGKIGSREEFGEFVSDHNASVSRVNGESGPSEDDVMAAWRAKSASPVAPVTPTTGPTEPIPVKVETPAIVPELPAPAPAQVPLSVATGTGTDALVEAIGEVLPTVARIGSGPATYHETELDRLRDKRLGDDEPGAVKSKLIVAATKRTPQPGDDELIDFAGHDAEVARVHEVKPEDLLPGPTAGHAPVPPTLPPPITSPFPSGSLAPSTSFANELKTKIVDGFNWSMNRISTRPNPFVGKGGPERLPTPAVATFGSTGGLLVDGIQGAAQGLEKFKMAALAASVASAGMVAASAPMTWATFTGSVQLLGGQIAGMLIPAFTQASGWIQDVAGWVRDLDEATKGTIATVAKWGGGLLVGGAILGQLGAILLPAIAGVYLLGKAFIMLNGAALFTPIGLLVTGLAAVVGVVGYLTDGFGLLGDSISRAGDRATEARGQITRLGQHGALASRRDYESALPPDVRRVIESAPAERQRESIEAHLSAAEGRRLAILQNTPNPGALQARIEEIMMMPRRTVTDQFFADPQADSRMGERRYLIVAAMRQAGLNQQQIDSRMRGVAISDAEPPTNPAQQRAAVATSQQLSGANVLAGIGSQIAVLRRIRDQGVPEIEGTGGILSAAPMQARTFQTGADFYSTIMQEALGRGSLEQENMRTLIENTQRQIDELVRVNEGVRAPRPAPP